MWWFNSLNCVYVCVSGSESALSVLESCIKQATPTATPTTDDDVGVVSGGVAREVWGSELAALLSPTKTNTIKVYITVACGFYR